MEIYLGSCCISSCFRRFLLFSSFLLSYSTIDTSRQPSLHISTISIFSVSLRISNFFFCFSFEKQTKISFKMLYFPSCSRLILADVLDRRISADRLRGAERGGLFVSFSTVFSCPLSRNKKENFTLLVDFSIETSARRRTTTHSGSGRMKTWLRLMRNVCVGFIYKTNDNENPV